MNSSRTAGSSLSWRNEFKPERAEGFSRLTYELEQLGKSVKLTVIHEMAQPDSKLIGAVTNGWPLILASLKSLLETGESRRNLPLAGRGLDKEFKSF